MQYLIVDDQSVLLNKQFTLFCASLVDSLIFIFFVR